MTINRFLKFPTIIALLILGAASSISAAEKTDIFSMSLEELLQIKVTIASRVEETFINAPSSVSVVTRSEIERLGVRSLSELLNYVPGFQSYMSPHESNRSLYMVRGLSDVYGRNLLLMIDGRRINDEYTSGFTFADHLLSLHNVKQVEFIRGPGSALYGSNAFSGVINIITDKQLKFAKVTLGTNNGSGLAAASYGQINTVQFSSALQYYRDNGQRYSGLADRNGVNLSTRDPTETFEGRLDLSVANNRLLLEYKKTQLEDYYVFRRINNGTNKNDTSRLGIYFEHDFKLPNGWQGSSRVGLMRHERQQELFLSPLSSELYVDYWRQDTKEAQIDFNHLTEQNHQISIGAYVGSMDIPLAFSSDTARYVLDNSRTTLGLYVQDQFDLSDDLRLTAGLRFDDYSDFGNSLNPRLALLYDWRTNESFKFMYGRAYRAPSLGDLYDVENIFGPMSPELDPVHVNTYEMAYLYSDNNNDFIVTWFLNQNKDFIAIFTNANGETNFENVYDNQIAGLEFELSWQLNTHWSTRFALTHILTNKTQAPIGTIFTPQDQLTPRNYGNWQLNYNENRWNWNISSIMRDGIKVLQDQGSLFIVNSNLRYQFNQSWELFVNFHNLFDQEYSTVQSAPLGVDQLGNTIQQLPSRGRELFISLQLNFDD